MCVFSLVDQRHTERLYQSGIEGRVWRLEAVIFDIRHQCRDQPKLKDWVSCRLIRDASKRLTSSKGTRTEAELFGLLFEILPKLSLTKGGDEKLLSAAL